MKYITSCIECNKERLVSRPMISMIKNNKGLGRCKSCALNGNNRRLDTHHSQDTRRKMSIVSLGKKKGLQHRLSISKGKKGKIRLFPLADKTDRRNDFRYKEWRQAVWLRDNFKCKIANPDCKGRIEAHHILPWRDYNELRYETNNGITLCHAHHPRKRAEEKRLIPTFQELVSVSKYQLG